LKLLKTIGTAAIASALLLSNVPLAFANEVGSAVSSTSLPFPGKGTSDKPVEAKITKEEAIKLAKTYIEIPEGYTLQSANLNSYSYYGYGSNAPSWSLSFTKQVGDRSYGNMNVTINGSTGRLISYSSYNSDPDYKPSYPAKVDYQGAKEAAAKWIAKLNPKEQADLSYNDNQEESFKTPLNGSFQYSVRYDRVENGVPFPQNGVNISVNGDGEVTSYDFQWDDTVTFAKATAISVEEATKAFREKSKLVLSYQMPYQARGEKKPIITYNMNTYVLNATNGEVWEQGSYPSASTSEAKPLTDAPLGEKPAGNLSLTKEQAVKKVSSVIKLPEGAELKDSSFNEYTNPQTGEVQSTWNLRWDEPTSDEDKRIGFGPESIWATVNSKTGEILNYNRYLPIPLDEQDKVEVKVTGEEAKIKAIDFVKKQLAAYTDQLVLDTSNIDHISEEQQKQIRNWDFSFQRMIDGVYANYENVSVSIDKKTGDIVNYHFNFSTIDYPETKPEVLSEDKALDLLLSPYEIELQYMLPNPVSSIYPIEKINLMIAAGEIPPGSTGVEKADTEAKLVYVLTHKYNGEPYILDAATGQWRNATNGEVTTLEKIKVSDIEGHWAQNELQIMLDYQALDVVDEKVSPDASITRGELIKMLVIAMNGGNHGIYYAADRAASFADVKNSSPYFAYVENAVDRGLIDLGKDFNPEAKMNREEMAELVVRALGYQTLATYEGIFNDSFEDASQLASRGEAAIVVGLGIMTLSDGSFNPKQEVTKAQAATAFFRYLQKRAELETNRGYYY
jgi:hypothetical protein